MDEFDAMLGDQSRLPSQILIGDCRDSLRSLADESVHCVVTSPPYFGLRDYGMGDQIGLEPSPQEFVAAMVEVFREVRRVLRPDGTFWLNLGDSYAGSGKGAWAKKTGQKEVYVPDPTSPQSKMAKTWDGIKAKDLIGIPWRVALALQDDGWYLRQDIIWHKPNAMPEPARDRCTKAHEYIFMFSKRPKYFFDHEAIKEPIQSDRDPSRKAKAAGAGRKELRGQQKPYDGEGDTRNKRSVWSVNTRPFKEAHFATYPPELIEPCILAGCPVGGTVLDPFFGAGTTGLVAEKHGRRFVGCELNPEYAAIARKRLGIIDLDPCDAVLG